MPEPRPGDEPARHRLKRLRMRSMRRGTKEMDIILGRFADTALQGLSAPELELYDALLSESDQDLYQWVTGQAAPPAPFAGLIDRIVRASAPAK